MNNYVSHISPVILKSSTDAMIVIFQDAATHAGAVTAPASRTSGRSLFTYQLARMRSRTRAELRRLSAPRRLCRRVLTRIVDGLLQGVFTSAVLCGWGIRVADIQQVFQQAQGGVVRDVIGHRRNSCRQFFQRLNGTQGNARRGLLPIA